LHNRNVLNGPVNKRGLALVVSFFLVTTLCVAPPAQAATPTVGQTLQTLVVAPAMTLGFAFKTFGAPRPKATDARGCGERKRVLIASAARAPRVGAGCRLVGGSWVVNGKNVNSVARIKATPLVSEKGAWAQGAFGWSQTTQRSFVRWYQAGPRECVVSSSPATRGCGYTLQLKGTFQKSASITDLMLQTQSRLSCPQSAGILGILSSWGLALDPVVRARVESADCANTPVKVVVKNRANPVTAKSVGNAYLSAGALGKAYSSTEVLTAPAGPVITSEQFGLHIPDVNGPIPTMPFKWLRLWDAKTGWEPLEQTRGTYYWKWIDDSVAFAEARGLKIAYVFGDTPAWAGPSPAFPPTQLAEFQRYVNAVVSRYGNRIHSYEVWNEPNLYAPMSKDVANLVDMTLAVGSAVDRWAPASLVLTPSTTMRTDTAVYPFFTDYLLPLAAKGWPVDGFSVHTYPRALEGPLIRSAQVGQFKQMLALAKAPALPIWDTEVNYGLAGLQEAKRSIDGPSASGYLSQTFLDSIRQGVTQTDWYLWFPRDYKLLGIQSTPFTTGTNAAWTWTHDQLVGSRLRACYDSTEAVVCGFERNGENFVVAWSPTGSQARVEVPAGLNRQCGISDACSAITGGVVTVGIEPIKLT
jgi:hypothetical protein